MSSMTRKLQRQIIRAESDTKAAGERKELRKNREKPTDSLSMNKNIFLFREAWHNYHYPSTEIIDKDGSVTTISKRKPTKRSNNHVSGKNLISRMNFVKTLKEKMVEKAKEKEQEYKEQNNVKE